jgi:hypothetical protein
MKKKKVLRSLRAQRPDFRKEHYASQKNVVTRLAYVLVRAMFFNENIKQSYGFPQTTSYKKVPQEQHNAVRVLLCGWHVNR